MAEHHEDGHARQERINQVSLVAARDRFDRAARAAADDVRRQDKSAEQGTPGPSQKPRD
jgi:hypothetical protein